MDNIGKWQPGASYGPVLSQTDLYLLQTELELHPILMGRADTFHLVFSLHTGQMAGFNADSRDRENTFKHRDEPATLPRVQQLILITEQSPWCTIVKNPEGVTIQDICQTVWKDYTDHTITEAEFAAILPRAQEQIKRIANNNMMGAQQWGGYYSPAHNPTTYKRVHWLRDRTYFEGLKKNDNYAAARLGFKAPNVYVLELSG